MKILATAEVYWERRGVTKVCMLCFKTTQTRRVAKETQGSLSLQRFVSKKQNFELCKAFVVLWRPATRTQPVSRVQGSTGGLETEHSTIPESCAVVNSRLLLGFCLLWSSRFDSSYIAKSAIRADFVFFLPWELPAFKRKIKATRENFRSSLSTPPFLLFVLIQAPNVNRDEIVSKQERRCWRVLELRFAAKQASEVPASSKICQRN